MTISIQKIGLCAATFALSACIRGGGLWEQDKSAVGSAATVKSFTNDDGAVVGKFAAGSTSTQSLTVDTGELNGTTLAIDPSGISGGSLSVAITTGSSLANSSLLSATGATGATSVSSASNSVSVTSDSVANASGTLSIPVTTSSLNLDSSSDDLLCVLYVVTDASLPEGARNVVGILGRDEITVSDGTVTFRFKSFGTYQVVRSNVAIKKGTQQASNAAKPLTAKQANTLPQIKFETIAHDVDASRRHHLKTTVSGSQPSTCRYLILRKANAPACFSVPAKVTDQSIAFDDDSSRKEDDKGDACKNDKTQSAGEFFVQSECLFADGRTGRSEVAGPYPDGDGLDVTSVQPGTIVPFNNLTDWLVEGTCKYPGTVTVAVRTATRQTTCNSNRWSVRLDLSTVADGDQKLIAQLFNNRNVASSERSVPIVVDRSIPKVSIGSPVDGYFVPGFSLATQANWASFQLAGSCSPNSGPIIIQMGPYQFQTSCGNGTWGKTMNLSTYPHLVYPTVAKQSSPAGRQAVTSPINVVVGAPIYGLGDDGNQTISGATTFDLSTFPQSSAPFHNLFGTARVDSSISCATGACTFTFGGTTFISNNIFGHEEVMWIVNASKGSGCGSDVGRYGFARVVSTAANVSLSAELTAGGTPPTFSSQTPVNQCVVQMIRVPNLGNLTISPTTVLNINTLGYDWDGTSTSIGKGGIIALRVAGTLNIVGYDINFDLIGRGFTGGSGGFQGFSSIGPGASSVASNNGAAGGAGGSFGGGGGAGYGNGGNVAGGGQGGVAYNPNAEDGCSTCYIPKRAYFGGGAGGAGGYAGGGGGGILMLFAAQLSIDAGKTLYAKSGGKDGANGATQSGGGGGGGTGIFAFGSINGPFVASVIGGNAGTASPNQGAGGGGGFIHTRICSGVGNLTAAVLSGSGSASGVSGQFHSETTDCF